MLSEVQIIILAVVIGVVGLFITYRVALHFIRKRSAKLIQESRKAAFAISGNLVVEYTSPITDNYRLTKTLLGRGASAEVFVGENINNNHRYAIKVIDMSRKDVLWRYEREKNFLKDIEHSNTVRLFEVYSSPKQMFFVMELCTGGHLGHLLKRTEDHHLPELQARTYILQIVRAIVHCHEHGICHRDIKLQNILLENNTKEAQVKIIDFGNAVRFLGCTPLKKVVGTTYTAAPEVFRQSYDERCDVWSLGVVAYILLSGRRPFERVEIDQTVPQTPLAAVGNASRGPSSQANLQQILPPLYHNSAEGTVIASILMGRYHFHHEPFKYVSREAIYFIKTCLQADYQQRSFAKDLLSHAWLRSDFPASYRAAGPAQSPKMSGPSSPAAATAALGSPISPPPFSLSPQPMQQRYMYAAPVISATGAQTLIESTHRHLSRADHTGMRNASMLAVAFSMPVLKVRKFRDLFQEIDRNGNGLIGKPLPSLPPLLFFVPHALPAWQRKTSSERRCCRCSRTCRIGTSTCSSTASTRTATAPSPSSSSSPP
jgi:serine/threonine protein kinase